MQQKNLFFGLISQSLLLSILIDFAGHVDGLSCYSELDWINYGTQEKTERTSKTCINDAKYCVTIVATSSKWLFDKCEKNLFNFSYNFTTLLLIIVSNNHFLMFYFY